MHTHKYNTREIFGSNSALPARSEFSYETQTNNVEFPQEIPSNVRLPFSTQLPDNAPTEKDLLNVQNTLRQATVTKISPPEYDISTADQTAVQGNQAAKLLIAANREKDTLSSKVSDLWRSFQDTILSGVSDIDPIALTQELGNLGQSVAANVRAVGDFLHRRPSTRAMIQAGYENAVEKAVELSIGIMRSITYITEQRKEDDQVRESNSKNSNLVINLHPSLNEISFGSNETTVPTRSDKITLAETAPARAINDNSLPAAKRIYSPTALIEADIRPRTSLLGAVDLDETKAASTTIKLSNPESETIITKNKPVEVASKRSETVVRNQPPAADSGKQKAVADSGKQDQIPAAENSSQTTAISNLKQPTVPALATKEKSEIKQQHSLGELDRIYYSVAIKIKNITASLLKAENAILKIDFQNKISISHLVSRFGYQGFFMGTSHKNELNSQLTIRQDFRKDLKSCEEQAKNLAELIQDDPAYKDKKISVDKKTPKLLVRASVPLTKVDNLPDHTKLFNLVTKMATEELSNNKESKASASIHNDGETLIVKRAKIDAETNKKINAELRFDYKRDGKVVVFERQNEGEWVKIGSAWNDDASIIAKKFIEKDTAVKYGKAGNLYKDRKVTAVTFKEDWTPEDIKKPNRFK